MCRGCMSRHVELKQCLPDWPQLDAAAVKWLDATDSTANFGVVGLQNSWRIELLI